MATEDEYRAKTHDALDKLWAQIDDLKKLVSEASADARERFDKAIDGLRKRQAETKSKLDQAAAATGDAWKNAAKGVEDAVDSLGGRLLESGRRDRHECTIGRRGGGEGPESVPHRVEAAAGRTKAAPRIGVTAPGRHALTRGRLSTAACPATGSPADR